MLKRIISLILVFALSSGICAYAEEAIIDLNKYYCSEKKYTMDDTAERVKYNTDSYNNYALGKLVVSGTMIDQSQRGNIPAFTVNGNEYFCFSYTSIPDLRTKDVSYLSWHIEDYSGKKVADIKLNEKVGTGCIIVQKSSDGINWTTTYEKHDVFCNYSDSIKNFYTPARKDLKDGCYYRILIAYMKMKKQTSDNLFASKYIKLWNIEEYIAYVISETDVASVVDTTDILPESIAEENETAFGVTSITDMSIANRMAGEEIFSAGDTGHGFAAEAANIQNATIEGVFNGDKVTHTGENNVKNGEDYIIQSKNGSITYIQSKYYKTAADTVNACFNESGNFRYYSPIDGTTPMQIEVPADQYDDAIELMRLKIEKGNVPGINSDDADEAENIIRKGTVTYQQAKNIAKAGNIDSIMYDTKNSCVLATTALGVSAAIQFATSIWNGESVDVALQDSIYTGLKIGGNAFATSILSSQLTKSGLNSLLKPGSEAITRLIGSKASSVIVNAARVGAKPIYGAAAMKSAAKLMRSNVITGTVSLLVFTVPDVVNIFRGRISAKQLLKNTAVTAGGIGGGFAGAAAGTTAGAALGSVVPIIGTAIGGIVGGIIGGIAGGIGVAAGVDAVADLIAEDDADEMLDIITDEFRVLVEEYLMNQEETENVSAALEEKLTASSLKDMYASKNRSQFARTILEALIQEEISKREFIELPSDEKITEGLSETLEEIHDEYLDDEGE